MRSVGRIGIVLILGGGRTQSDGAKRRSKSEALFFSEQNSLFIVGHVKGPPKRKKRANIYIWTLSRSFVSLINDCSTHTTSISTPLTPENGLKMPLRSYARTVPPRCEILERSPSAWRRFPSLSIGSGCPREIKIVCPFLLLSLLRSFTTVRVHKSNNTQIQTGLGETSFSLLPV